ncbi:Oligopeptide transporter 2 [Yarrowia lipolytica]|nr:Oligopeptide transporter 2 [Yarrowia lipolytica]
MQFQFSINDICTKHNAMKFSCPNETTLFSASIIWGLVGPKRIFDHQYPVLKWMFLRGAGTPQLVGNNVSTAGRDGSTIPPPPLPDVGYFGPGPGNYS